MPALRAALFTLFCAVALLGRAADALPPVVNLCHLVRASSGPTQAFLATRFTVQYYSSRFTNHTFQVVPIQVNVNAAISDAVRAYVNYGGTCHALLGPGSSSFSVAVSPVASVPWVDFAATSVQLSDKTVYPWFSRVITTDAQIGGAMADVLRTFGWGTATVVAGNDAYGTSVSQQLTSAFVAQGGVVTGSMALPLSASIADVTAAYAVIERGNTRVIAVGMDSSSALYRAFINVTVTRQLHTRYIFLFSESACSGNTLWRSLPGALCVTFSQNTTRLAPVLAAYTARDWSTDAAVVASYGRLPALDAATATSWSVFCGFAHDAALLMMTSLNNVANVSNFATSLQNLRSPATAIQGITGDLSLQSNGDRAVATMLLLNVNSNGNEVASAVMANRTVTPLVTVDPSTNASNPTTQLPYIFWLAAYYSNVPPSDSISAPFAISITLIAVAVGSVVLAACLGLVIVLARRNKEVLQKMIGLGFIGHFGSATFTLAVLLVKVLVAVNLYFSGAALGYLIPYYSVVSISVIAIGVDFITRFRYLKQLASTDGSLSITAQASFEGIINKSVLLVAVCSDLPSIVIAAFLMVNGEAGSIALLLALTIVTAFNVGMKAQLIPTLLVALANDESDDDDDDLDEEDHTTGEDSVPVEGAAAAAVPDAGNDARARDHVIIRSAPTKGSGSINSDRPWDAANPPPSSFDLSSEMEPPAITSPSGVSDAAASLPRRRRSTGPNGNDGGLAERQLSGRHEQVIRDLALTVRQEKISKRVLIYFLVPSLLEAVGLDQSTANSISQAIVESVASLRRKPSRQMSRFRAAVLQVRPHLAEQLATLQQRPLDELPAACRDAADVIDNVL